MKQIKFSARPGDLVWDLLVAAKLALGPDGSTGPGREFLSDAVVAIENACVKNGKFKLKYARGKK